MTSLPTALSGDSPAPPHALPRVADTRARWLTGLLVALLLMHYAAAREGLLSKHAAERYSARYGAEATQRLQAWERLMLEDANAEEARKLARVNDFFNRVPWLSDEQHWGRRDYWATPLEMLGTYGGDCEDFSIAKFITLVEMGVSPDKLRITYVRAPRLRQPHMVLAYYPTPDAEPLILDNLDGVIRPATQRRDLIPVYSFNASGLWSADGSRPGRRLGGASRLNGWRDVSRRMRLEGMAGNP